MGGGGGRKGILRSVSSPVVSRVEGSFDKLRTNGEGRANGHSSGGVGGHTAGAKGERRTPQTFA